MIPIGSPLTDYVSRYLLVADGTFIQRVTMAAEIEAGVVLQEDKTTPNHDARVALAKSLQVDPGRYAGPFAYRVVSDLGLLTVPDDPTLQLEIANAWDYIS